MSPNPRGIAPLNWRTLVAEAIRRRKAEKLTQREHAALASVSIPTIVAFDRGERTLTLAKAFDILRVVGLIEEPSEEGAQEVFVQKAFARWRELTSQPPEDSPGRFPNGWYRIDYALEGDLKNVELHEFQRLLEEAIVPHTGWPMFLMLQRPELAPREVDGAIECWVRPPDGGVERMHADAAHCDFWRAAPAGRMFLIRGYQEDAQETFAPGTIFDTTLVIWRLGEALLHAARLAKLLARDAETKVEVRFRALYTGLSGRRLSAWANPLAELLVEGAVARSDEAMLETRAPAEDIEGNLAHYVFPLAVSLFERFGVAGLSVNRVESEVARLQKSRVR